MSNSAYRNYLNELQCFINSIVPQTIQNSTGQYSGNKNISGLPHGIGKLVNQDGSRYEGSFINGVMSGFGKSWDSDGKTDWSGIWENNFPFTGKGIIDFEGGCRFEGELNCGLRQGKGTCQWPDGTKYEGEWIADNYHGSGTQCYSDGTQYNGEFSNGLRHGKGRYQWPDGVFHEGNWINGFCSVENGQDLPLGKSVLFSNAPLRIIDFSIRTDPTKIYISPLLNITAENDLSILFYKGNEKVWEQRNFIFNFGYEWWLQLNGYNNETHRIRIEFRTSTKLLFEKTV